MRLTPTQRMLSANLLILMEGLRIAAYQDGGGVWTLGVGSTVMPSGRRVTKGDGVTHAEALALVEKQIDAWAAVIGKCISAPLSDGWIAVLCSFVHQEGIHALPGSVLADMLNAGLLERAGRQLNGWVIATAGGVRGPQLGIMRRMEAQRRTAGGLDMNVAHGQVWMLGDSMLLPLYEAACADAARFRNGVVTWEVHSIAPAPQPDADDLNAAQLAKIAGA